MEPIRVKKYVVLLLSALLLAASAVGCGGTPEESELKTGPTVTPIPDTATEDAANQERYEFGYSDAEVEEVLSAVRLRAAEASREYDFKITDEMITDELAKHDDGSSEVYVYDKDDNLLAVLMYDKDRELERAHINNYEGGVLISGRVYIDGILSEYFETAEGTGKFRVDAELKYEEEANGEGGDTVSCRLSYVTEKGVVYREY